MKKSQLENYAAGAAGLVVLGLLAWIAVKGLPKVTATLTKTAVSGATGAAAGVVVGLGEAVGIPETNMDACNLALAEGRWWDASFACPASVFVKAIAAPKPVQGVPSVNSKSVLYPILNDYVGDFEMDPQAGTPVDSAAGYRSDPSKGALESGVPWG